MAPMGKGAISMTVFKISMKMQMLRNDRTLTTKLLHLTKDIFYKENLNIAIRRLDVSDA